MDIILIDRIKTVLKWSIFLLLLLASLYHNSYAEVSTTTPNAIASPRKSYPLLFVMHSEEGLLIKRTETEYQLVLNKVDNQVNYRINDDILNNGSYSINAFIALWNKNRSKNVQADVTGIQINNKTMGHTQFYTSAILTNPQYIAKKNQLILTLKLTDTPINVDQYARFHNATLFINGCTLCNCTNIVRVCT